LLEAKSRRNLDRRFPKERRETINEFVELFVI